MKVSHSVVAVGTVCVRECRGGGGCVKHNMNLKQGIIILTRILE